MEDEKYVLDPEVEEQCALLSCADPSFWGRLGREIDPQRVKDRRVALILSALRAIEAEHGSVFVANKLAVMQRIASWVGAGRIKQAVQISVAALLRESPDLSAVESLVAEVGKEVRRCAFQDVLIRGIEEHKETGQVSSSLSSMLDTTSSIGRMNVAPPVYLGPEHVSTVEVSGTEEGVQIYIEGLDTLTRMLPFKQFGGVLGAPGAGKSLLMNQVALCALVQGFGTAYVSLEVPAEMQHLRTLGGLSKKPYRDLTAAKDRESIISRAVRLPKFGRLVTAYYDEGILTPAMLESWLDREEAKIGSIRVLVLDYAELMDEPSEKQDNSKLKSICGKLRKLARQRNMLVFTGFQPKASALGKKSGEYLDLGDIGGSAGPARTADFLFSFSKDDKTKDITYFGVKGRYLDSRQATTPCPNYAEFGVLTRFTYWDWVEWFSILGK